MKKIPGWGMLLLFFSTPVWAGEIYGSIRQGKRSIGAGTKVEIQCGRNAYAAETDRYGSYRLYLPEKGRCRLRVQVGARPPSMEIYSYEGSVRYDLVLERQGEKYFLRRE